LNSFTIYSLLILSGVCLYAVINHLSIGLRRPLNAMHLCFAGLCLCVACAVFGRVESYQARSVEVFIRGLRGNLSCICIGLILFHWVIASFTRVRPRPYLIAISLLLAGLSIWNLASPYTMQFREISGISQLTLPWGESLASPVGQHSRLFLLFIAAIFSNFSFALYALNKAWRRDRERPTMVMILAVVFFLLMVAEGIAARASVIDFIHLGWLGFFVMIITMSFILSNDAQKRVRDSERRFRSLLEQSPFSIQLFSPDGFSCQANPAWQQLWHNKPGVHASGYNILHDDELVNNGVMPYLKKGFAGEAVDIPPALYELNKQNMAGDTRNNRWLRTYVYPIRNENRCIRDVIVMHEDVTYKKHVEDAFRLIAAGLSSASDEEFFRQLINNLAQVFEADYACLALQDVHEQQQLNVLAVYDNGTLTAGLGETLNCPSLFNIMTQGTSIYSADNADFPRKSILARAGAQAVVGTPLLSGENQPGVLVVLNSKPFKHVEQAREIIEIFAARAGAELQRRSAETDIRRLAYEDYLTGLANRAQLHQELRKSLSQTKYESRRGALLLIDLDHFKNINDALGHNVGDEVLRAVAKRIIECSDDSIYLARFGGDEFVALLESDDRQDRSEFENFVSTLAHRILLQLATTVFAGDRAFTIGASIGIVHFPEDGDSDLDILRHADMALYQAKHRGRGIIQVYSPELEVAASNRLQLEAGLRTAIDKNELEIYFQPQVDVQGAVVGAEALLRWNHPELGNIPPDTFIPVAEESGLIHRIGNWVFDQACAKLIQWSRDGIPFRGHLSINVCPWQFARPDFISEIHTILQNHDVDPQRLMLELTESALLHDVDDAIDKLKTLRKFGLRIALDDFGTGYSSLAYLRDLPLDQLKIDKSFVSELSSSIEHPLVESMIAIGKHMKLAVVAEGVETQIQRDKLILLGCEKFQGYLFCRPIPEPELSRWLFKQIPN